ncbi:uncharacterized protein [Parasteatoda tepidariorum]|uniref:uncharacterized protein n=1 Tax=Parasteatoda tepidariorum TaxID=114398 RepID=UPI00077F9E6C|nr:uncharacterized protein LOC107451110 [Parasteatoda tepidariorum]
MRSFSASLTSLLILLYCGDVLSGVGIQPIQSQNIPPSKPQPKRDSLQLHLPVIPQQQSNYLILPKSSFILPKNNGHLFGAPSNRNTNRRPANGPPEKLRPELQRNKQRNPPQNRKPNLQFNNGPHQPAASQQHKHVLSNLQYPPRNNFKLQIQEATIPQNIKPDQNGQNRPPILPNFQVHPPLVNHNPNEFLHNGLPPRKLKQKNHQKNIPVLLPTHDIESGHIGEPSQEIKHQVPILPQTGPVDIDLAHLLSAPQHENEVVKHSFSHSVEVHPVSGVESSPQDLHEDIHKLQHAEKLNGGPFDELQAHIAKTHGDPLQQNIPGHGFPFPDFAEPEPGPQLKHSNFPLSPNLNLNNRIITPEESKQSQVSVRAKASDVYDQAKEESAPIALYGQVLPPNDATYSSEINNFPGLHDHESAADEDRWPIISPEMPKIVHLDVKCEKNLMRVSIDFDKPFHGIIYSKGHFSYGRCVHLPAGSGHNSVQFDISINSCGMQGNSPSGHYGPTETGSYFENTVVVQYDPLVQEVWDQARKLRCNWHDQYEKTVTFRPFNVDMLQVVRADFAGDNVGCWMQIQVGKGPWANEVAGIVRIGQTMTLVLAIKDDESKFDMMVRNCIAHDGNRAPIELVDSSGCITRPKLMSRFTKVKNFGSSASVLSFAHFQAFKFPDSTEVHIQCTVQICRHQCEEQCSIHRRRKRQAIVGKGEVREIGLNSILQVVAVEDLTFSPYQNKTDDDTNRITTEKSKVCMSSSGFAASLILLLSIVVISSLIAAFLFLKQRNTPKMPPLPYDMAVFKKHVEKQIKKQQQQQQQKKL